MAKILANFCRGPLAFILVQCAIASLAVADDAQPPPDTWQIHGRVVDEHGKLLDDFVAATFWSANGKKWDDHGQRLKYDTPADRSKHWSNEGVFAAFPDCTAQHTAPGEFVATIEDRPRETVFATDLQQQRGGYVSVEKKDADTPVTITLAPLVRVTGKIYCPQAARTPDWTAAVVHPVGDQDNYLHFTICGSLKGEFSFLLPPGKYDLDVYSNSPDARMPRPAEREQHDAPADMPDWLGGIRLEVPSGRPTLDLGVLNVMIPAGRGDYSSLYGKDPPPLQFTDARGVSKDLKLSDLRGKWVLLSFWSLGCPNCCLGKPKNLAKFCSDHAADRSRFEILTICSTDDVDTIADFEKREPPVAQEACHADRLPYPVLIDAAANTMKAYGVSGYHTLLIDPDGRLVRWGDEMLLAEKLAGLSN